VSKRRTGRKRPYKPQQLHRNGSRNELVRNPGLLDPRITPEAAKVHLASHNGTDNPLRVYFEGKFDEWQSWQNKRNFGKPFVSRSSSCPSGTAGCTSRVCSQG